VFFVPYYYAFFFIINVLTVYSLFNAGSLNMGKGKDDGKGLLSRLTTMISRSGRLRNIPPPPQLAEDDSSQGGRGRGAPRGGGGGERAPRGGRDRGQK
jgi:hypothetical protein